MQTRRQIYNSYTTTYIEIHEQNYLKMYVAMATHPFMLSYYGYYYDNVVVYM